MTSQRIPHTLSFDGCKQIYVNSEWFAFLNLNTLRNKHTEFDHVTNQIHKHVNFVTCFLFLKCQIKSTVKSASTKVSIKVNVTLCQQYSNCQIESKIQPLST